MIFDSEGALNFSRFPRQTFKSTDNPLLAIKPPNVLKVLEMHNCLSYLIHRSVIAFSYLTMVLTSYPALASAMPIDPVSMPFDLYVNSTNTSAGTSSDLVLIYQGYLKDYDDSGIPIFLAGKIDGQSFDPIRMDGGNRTLDKSTLLTPEPGQMHTLEIYFYKDVRSSRFYDSNNGQNFLRSFFVPAPTVWHGGCSPFQVPACP